MLKSIKRIAVIVIGSFTLASCSLEEIVPDSITPDKISKEEDVLSLIYGIYAPMNNPDGFKYEIFKYLFLAGDDIYAHGIAEMQNISAKTFTAENTESFWNMFYSVIGNCNNLIDVLDKLELSANFEKRAYGEAHYMRALSYYYLVRIYGGVPLRKEVTTRDSNYQLKRSEVNEVYELIFEDFNIAANSLPVRSKLGEADLGRATKGAAQGMLAQAHLTYANHIERAGNRGEAEVHYQKAVSFADSVMMSLEYKLLDDYGKLWGVDNEIAAYEEVMFGVRFSADPARVGFGANGSEFAYRFLGTNTWGVTSDKPNGAGAAQIRPQLWATNAAYSGDYAVFTLANIKPVVGERNYDYRAQITYFQKGYNNNLNMTTNQFYTPFYLYPISPEAPRSQLGYNSATTAVFGKYIDASGYDSRNHGNDFFIMRYAEIPLIKAEALNELNGPNELSVDLLNVIRNRARKADGVARTYPILLTLGTHTKESFRRKVLEERHAEFHSEGLRWFDLIRMTSHTDPTKTMYDYQFEEFLPTQMVGTPSLNNTTRAWTIRGIINVATSRESTHYDPKFKLFPVPSSELINNPNFGVQNPGWN